MEKRTVIIGFAGALVGASCGFLAGWFLMSPACPVSGEVPETAASASSVPSAAPVYDVGVFVEVGPVFLPVLGKRGIEQNISVTVVIEVADKETAAEVEKIKPRLADVFIRDLYGALRSPGTGREILDVSAIKMRIEKKVQEILGEDVVRDVLLKNVTQVPM